MESVSDHTPGEASLVDACSTLFDVVAHQGFTTRDDDKHLMGIGLFRDAIEHSEEILLGHIPRGVRHFTIAATMATLQVTA